MNIILSPAKYSVAWWARQLRRGLHTHPKNWDKQLTTLLTPGPLWEKQASGGMPSIKNWPRERSIPAQAIRDALLDPELQPDPQGLTLNGIYVSGSLDLDGSHIPCPLNITYSQFQSTATLRRTTIPALNFSHSIICGLDLTQAHIDGDCELNSIRAVTINFADDRHTSTAIGVVNAVGASIKGHLQLVDAVLVTRPQDTALNLQQCEAGGVLMERLRTNGAINAHSCNIASQLDLENAKIRVAEKIDALILQQCKIAGNAYFQRISIVGTVFAHGATVNGKFDFTDATITTLDNVAAINIAEAAFGGSVYLTGIATPGLVDAMGAQFARGLHLDTRRMSTSGIAAQFSHCTITRLRLYNCASNPRPLDLSHSTIGTLFVDQKRPEDELFPPHSYKSIPPLADALGWSVKSIRGFLGTDKEQAAAWLDTVPTASRGTTPITVATSHQDMAPIPGRKAYANPRKVFTAQPWKEIAGIYSTTGQLTQARWLRYQAAKRTTNATPGNTYRWMRRAFYGWTVGYGYRPWLALLWILGAYCLGVAITANWADQFVLSKTPEGSTSAATPAAITRIVDAPFFDNICVAPEAKENKGDHPPLNTCLYAVDSTIPLAATGQNAAWRPTSAWISASLAAIKAAIWALTALLLGGITGLLRKD